MIDYSGLLSSLIIFYEDLQNNVYRVSDDTQCPLQCTMCALALSPGPIPSFQCCMLKKQEGVVREIMCIVERT